MFEPERPPVRAVLPITQPADVGVFIAFDEAGGVRLAGCPNLDAEGGLAATVAELLATSGRLWNQPVAQVTMLYERACGEPLVEAVRRRAGPGWVSDRFMLDLARSLREGRFAVALFVDRRDTAVDDALVYLKGMNLDVLLLGHEHFQQGGLEMVRPVLLSAAQPRSVYGPALQPASDTRTVAPRPTAATKAAPKEYPPFPTEGVAPAQREILKRLVYLEDLGLTRRGFEFYAPHVEGRPEAEGTIAIVTDKTRWPFPSEHEVFVVVRTSREHLAGFLGMKQQEVEDFLGSLPREPRKERKGALLLRASNAFEANQLVNELKALREVASTIRSG